MRLREFIGQLSAANLQMGKLGPAWAAPEAAEPAAAAAAAFKRKRFFMYACGFNFNHFAG